MALSEAQAFGYSENVQELFRKASRELNAGNVDAEKEGEELHELHERALAANARQEEAKRVAKAATEAFNELKIALVRKTSSALDMAIGAVGKETVSAKNFRRLRSDIQRATTKEEIDAVTVEVPPAAGRP